MRTCANCDHENAPAARFCGECGAELTQASPGSTAGVSTLESAPPAQYAGFWRRTGAWAIDGVITIGIASISTYLVFFVFLIPQVAANVGFDPFLGALLIRGLVPLVAAYSYYVLLTGLTGQTVGKIAVGIRVVDKSGKKPGLARAALREVLGKPLSGICLLLGFVWVAWDHQKRAWHDLIAGTRVIRGESEALQRGDAVAVPASGTGRSWHRPAAILAFSFVILIAASLLARSIVRFVGDGEVGVVHTFGVVDPKPRLPGLVLKAPWASLETMNVRTQQFTLDSQALRGDLVPDGDIIRTLTSDGATASIGLTVSYRIQADQAPHVFSTVGPDYASIIIRPAVRNAVRDVVVEYTLEEINPVHGEEIRDKIMEQLKSDLEPRGILAESALMREMRIESSSDDQE